jgi:hypothetical protein
MSQAKQASKRKRTRKAVPVAGLGLAGLSLSLVGGATTAIGGPAANMPTQANAPSHEITLGEEEISDVSLGTFYVFDKENLAPRPGVQLARAGGGGGCAHGGGGRGCGGARGCGGGHGCGGRGCGGRGCGGRGCGLGGCGCWGGCGCGCCLSWGGCAIC